MKDCYKLFIQLSLQQCLKNDYNDKEKVKTQNKATKKLQQIQKEMKQVDCFWYFYMNIIFDDDYL